MIETATARRTAGDWAGACAAAGFDVDIDLRRLARTHGRELAHRVRADLRNLAPDLLRWHMPRVAPDGLLRPGLTIALAGYPAASGNPSGGNGFVHLVARTAPAWAESGQRITLALWDGARTANGPHPHPRPDRRYRLDLHRHLWDARRADELGPRSDADGPAERWAAEARILLDAEGRQADTFLLRLGARRRVVAELTEDDDGAPLVRRAAVDPAGGITALPVLPDAATWALPDRELLRAGVLSADQLHPLVAAALVPDRPAGESRWAGASSDRERWVRCRGEQHRIGMVDGMLTALDHDPDEIRREELLVALTGTPLPCLRAIDQAHRNPDCLTGVRERLDHGDTAGALAVVEGLLGPEAVLRAGALRDELEASAHRRVTYGLYRAGLTRLEPCAPAQPRPRDRRAHPRHATTR
ncbi:hypothetical protein JK358_36090 [Nocardia sp. 2]|uniref:HEAT repeat domain-containing protein n=2 Tax=Nocardia acididurans TaxID=2802282 RepID=A0ABS1MKQ4_9NOCA|nr:hypothetical protein [Nocardia acididurans]